MITRLQSFFKNSIILVTGGTGSIGSQIIHRVLKLKPKVVRVLSNDEDGLFSLRQELSEHKNIRFLLGDIREKERLKMAFENVDFVFHAAALKHVPGCEYNPFEAVKTNVIGTQNVIEAALEQGVKKMITISTDKAVNPVSVMGATKLLSERLTISANHYKGKHRTVFSCVRFGNVLDSRGSIVSIFRRQIRDGRCVTVTDPLMTRFIMSLPKAVNLVLEACMRAKAGEIFILKMPAVRIGDLAQVLVEELAPRYGNDHKSIKVKIIGKRKGEKDYEELLTIDEMNSANELEKMYAILPEGNSSKKIVSHTLRSNSARLLNKEEIRRIIRESL